MKRRAASHVWKRKQLVVSPPRKFCHETSLTHHLYVISDLALSPALFAQRQKAAIKGLTINETTIRFFDKIARLGLDVDRIAAVHGPTATLDDLRKAIEKSRSRR